MSEFSIWSGIFSDFESARGEQNVFSNNVWIEKQRAKVQDRFCTLSQNAPSQTNTSKDYPLAIVAALELSQRERLVILDIGGGMGEQYLEIVGKVPSAKDKIDFTIVENEALNSSVPKELSSFKYLHFISSLSEYTQIPDVVHFGSSLQYIDDWRVVLSDISKRLGAKIIVISDFLAGDVPSFVTLQRYGESSIPVRMYNEKEFCDYLNDLGFEVFFRSYFNSNVLNNEYLPTAALPETHKIKKTLNICFRKL